MADVTTKKLLIDVEARYVSISNALKEMSNLAVQIQALKTLRKTEQDENGKTSQSYIALDTQLKSTQKEYNTLSRFVVAANVSAKAMESTLAEGGSAILSQEAQLAKLTLAWKGMSAETRATPMGQALKAQIDSVTQSLFANGTQLDKNKLTVGNYAGAIEGLIVKMGAEGQAIGATSQAYTALLMKYQMAEAETRQLILSKGENDAASVASIAKMKQYGMELDKLNMTMGKYQAKTVNAMYSTFSLTQVMREMPNFAIDARIGFMALSNNLPMLADDFKRLTVQLGSAKLAFQAFAKSLLGLNTIMVILVTVMMMWGPQIFKWIGALFAGSKAVDAQTQKLAALNEVLKKGDSGLKNAIASQIKLGVVLDKAKDGTISGDAAVREYNKTLGEHYGKVNSLTGAMDGYVKHSQEYIRAMMSQAAAMKIVDQTADDILKKQGLQTQLEGIKNIDQLRMAYAKLQAVAEKTPDGLEKLKQFFDDPSLAKLSLMPTAFYKATSSAFGLANAFNAFQTEPGAEKFVKLMGGISKQDAKIENTTKVVKSLFNALDLELTKSDPAETIAQKVKRLSDAAIAEAQIRNEAAENAIKEEEGYQSEDFSKKQVYEKRLFDLKQQFEAEKFGILVLYHEKTAAQQAAFNATQQNDALTFEKKQTSAVKKELDKRNKDVAAARKALLTLLSGKGNYGNEQAEIQAVTEKYDAELQAYKDSLAAQGKLSDKQVFDSMVLSIQTEEQKQAAIAAIKAEYREREYANTRAGIIQQFADESALARMGVEERYAITKKRVDGEIELLRKQYNATDQMSAKDSERYTKLIAERTANDKAYEENKVAVKEFFMDKATELLSSINDIADGFSERDKERVQTNHDEAITANDDKLSKGLISQKAHDNEVKRLDKQLDKEKQKIARDQAIRERLMATISIGMNTAKAIMGIWADFPKMDFGISAGIASGIVGALGLAQAAAVWAQPMPKAAKGMLLQGPSHSGGGVNVNAEGGEAIINRRSTSMFKPLLSAINAAGGGVRFASGGIPVGLANDGGFSARQGVPFQMGPTAREIAQAVAEMQISVSVEQIEKAQTKFVKVRGRANF